MKIEIGKTNADGNAAASIQIDHEDRMSTGDILEFVRYGTDAEYYRLSEDRALRTQIVFEVFMRALGVAIPHETPRSQAMATIFEGLMFWKSTTDIGSKYDRAIPIQFIFTVAKALGHASVDQVLLLNIAARAKDKSIPGVVHDMVCYLAENKPSTHKQKSTSEDTYIPKRLEESEIPHQDWFREWIASDCIIEENAWSKSGPLFKAWNAYMSGIGLGPDSIGMFNARMLYTPGIAKSRDLDGDKVMGFSGIRLKDDPQSKSPSTTKEPEEAKQQE